jgi:hypothetical protein
VVRTGSSTTFTGLDGLVIGFAFLEIKRLIRFFMIGENRLDEFGLDFYLLMP